MVTEMKAEKEQQQQNETTAKPKMKSTEDTIKALREEAKSNRALNSICHIFAMRERARSQITIGSIRQTMYKEGFSFSRPEIEKVLRFMANIGIGKLHYDRSGKLHALKDIKITLKSIGLAAISESNNTFETATNQKKFVNLPAVSHQKQVTIKQSPEAEEEEHDSKQAVREVVHVPVDKAYLASLVVTIEGKTVNFPLPRKITTKELGEILSQEYSKK